jgi:hypothetical protein
VQHTLHLVLRLAGGGVDDGDGLAGGGRAPLPVGVVLVDLPVQDLREHPRARHRRRSKWTCVAVVSGRGRGSHWLAS